MRLTEDLAQGIVDKTMSVIGKNINIMDHNGIIIGSGNKNRINTYHECAVKVIETGQKLIVTENKTEEFRGVEVGINLPIRFNNIIIGVVGITGDVDEVQSYGEIVKNLVELMLSHNFLQKEIALEHKAKENYYQQLLSNNIKNDELFNDRAKLFDVDFDLYRVVMVIKTLPIDNKLLHNKINDLYSLDKVDKEQDIVLIRGENLVFIKSLKSNTFKEQCKVIQSQADKLLKELEDAFDFVEIGVGQVFPVLKRLYLSYEGAKHALEVGEKVYDSKEKIYYLDHLGYDYFIPYIDSESAEYYLHHILESDIAELFDNNDIGPLIEALADNNLNISKAADALYVHRNTLLYRLNKIKDMTGYDPKDAKCLFTLLLAYHLYLYRK